MQGSVAKVARCAALKRRETGETWRTECAGGAEFYLVHKIATDVSFHIVFGIFIPHTRLIVSLARAKTQTHAGMSALLPACLLITEGKHRYEYTTEAA